MNPTGKPCAAKGSFPYPHRTVAEIDAGILVTSAGFREWQEQRRAKRRELSGRAK